MKNYSKEIDITKDDLERILGVELKEHFILGYFIKEVKYPDAYIKAYKYFYPKLYNEGMLEFDNITAYNDFLIKDYNLVLGDNGLMFNIDNNIVKYIKYVKLFQRKNKLKKLLNINQL